MKQAKRGKRPTVAEIQELLPRYDHGTQSRVSFCATHRLPVSTLDTYRRRDRQPEPHLIGVEFRAGETPESPNGAVAIGFGSGRRREFAWAELAQLTTLRRWLRTRFTLCEGALRCSASCATRSAKIHPAGSCFC